MTRNKNRRWKEAIVPAFDRAATNIVRLVTSTHWTRSKPHSAWLGPGSVTFG